MKRDGTKNSDKIKESIKDNKCKMDSYEIKKKKWGWYYMSVGLKFLPALCGRIVSGRPLFDCVSGHEGMSSELFVSGFWVLELRVIQPFIGDKRTCNY